MYEAYLQRNGGLKNETVLQAHIHVPGYRDTHMYMFTPCKCECKCECWEAEVCLHDSPPCRSLAGSNCSSMYFPNRLELLLTTVCALPNASNSGLTWNKDENTGVTWSGDTTSQVWCRVVNLDDALVQVGVVALAQFCDVLHQQLRALSFPCNVRYVSCAVWNQSHTHWHTPYKALLVAIILFALYM